MSTEAKRVLLLEFNEITWRLIDPLIKKGSLPTFERLIASGTKGTPMATEDSANLDPWISWTSLYTGRPQSEHGVRFLEQPASTVTGPRIWELAADGGKSVGVFGSIMSWPPRTDIKGFWVPSTFSPEPDTFPTDLQPLQELNLAATRAHNPLKGGNRGMLKFVARLMRLGLKPSTLKEIASFFVRTRLRPHRKWEKVSLQPLINLDCFEKLYRKHRPEFATFHTNHVAHYQHRYWRAMDSTPFLVPSPDDERRRFGQAIEFGYQVADRVLNRLWKAAGPDTVIVLASGLGQQPYVVEQFKEGRQVIRIRDINLIVERCGLMGHCTPVSMMAPQWNLQVHDADKRAHAIATLKKGWYRHPDVPLFAFEVVGDTINLNIAQKNLHPIDMSATCDFGVGGPLRLEDVAASQDATPKQGYHDPAGVLVIAGPGIRQGARLAECTNLDVAPTLLTMLGLPVPHHMTGRVLEECLSEKLHSPPSDQTAHTPLDAVRT